MPYLTPPSYETYGLDRRHPRRSRHASPHRPHRSSYCRRPSLMAAQYSERVRLIAGSQTLRLSYGPLLDGALLSARRIRYARPRRGEDGGINFTDRQTATSSTRSPPPSASPALWSDARRHHASTSTPAPAKSRSPQTFSASPYNEAEITYTAGFVTVPVPVMVACAQIVQKRPGHPRPERQIQPSSTPCRCEYFSAEASSATRASPCLLEPYRAERLG